MKINKIKISNLSRRLSNVLEVKKINESFVFSFGKFKGLKIRLVILNDPSYVAWCIAEKMFTLDATLDKLLEWSTSQRTFTADELDPKKHNDLPWD